MGRLIRGETSIRTVSIVRDMLAEDLWGKHTRAFLMSQEQGESQASVARHFEVSEATLSRWCARVREEILRRLGEEGHSND